MRLISFVLPWKNEIPVREFVSGAGSDLVAKNSLRIWKKILLLYIKDGKLVNYILKLSCSTVAKTIQRFKRTGSTQNRPRHGRPKKLRARAQRHIQRLCLGKRCMSAASIAAEVKGEGGQHVSAQTIRRTLHQIGLHGCHPRRKPLLKMMLKKACKQFAENKQLDYWYHVLWSDETKINFGSDGVKRVWRYQLRSTKTSVSCLQSSMVVGVSWSGAAWVLPALGRYSSLREPWMPTCTVTYWSRAWSPPFRDWAAGQYSNMITTAALLKKLRVKVMDCPSMSLDLNPIEHLWGILKWSVWSARSLTSTRSSQVKSPLFI